MHLATGTLAINGTGFIQTEQLVINQINALSGVLGQKITIIDEDGAID